MESLNAMWRGRVSRQAVVWPALVLASWAVATAPASAAGNYPNRPIRFVVPVAAGSGVDIVARLLQPYLEKSLGQPVIVENRSGASLIIGADAAAKAAPDGHTLLIVTSTFTVNVATQTKLPFEVERDFEPITTLVKNPLLLATNAKLPARTLTEFVALAKAKPAKFNYATPGTGSVPHLLIEMLSARAGIKMQHVPYRGGGPASVSVAAGETQLALLSPAALQPHIQSGKVRSLATGDLARDPEFRDLPTIAESGFPDFEATQWLGLLTTGRTPKAIVQRLNVAFNRALNEISGLLSISETSGTSRCGDSGASSSWHST